jgi:AcrR family transcriptional regulator
MKPAKKETYHHGDLRSALVALALERVRKGGAESFSLREAARDAGVTSGAAYKHFADKDELLAAVAAEALALLAQRSEKATAGLKGKKRLHASAMSYIDFAASEPRLFRLAFSRFGSDGATEMNGLPGAFTQLRTAVSELQDDPAKPVDSDALALAWAVAHGIASLISDGMWKRNDPRVAAALRLSFKGIAPGK